ncbi:DUF6924 domain-containing protein [Kineosporia babensis]|uniref:DUF6924 domain-containing protein n=1 Tax=Kineosporia babensis TaxID=499548 RepID=A0A9X1NBP5_9ACTN|nr:hypothetical protein [Kineosporia babensis]MCD5312257.1 hypothetical protein [Kineosporia babensis]
MVTSSDSNRLVLRRGEYLHEDALHSPSGRFSLRNGRSEPAVMVDTVSGAGLWTVCRDNVYGATSLVLGLDGDLVVWNHHRDRGWRSGTAGLDVEHLQVTDDGTAELIGSAGQVVWSSAGLLPPSQVPDEVTGREPDSDQERLQNLFDSLAPDQGYTVTVVLDVEPAEALCRWGLPEAEQRRATWPELRAQGQIPVAAVSLGTSTLLVAGAAWLPGDPLSRGTTVVRESRVPGTGWTTEWSLHRDGETVSHLREGQPKRRIGMSHPEVLQAARLVREEPYLQENADWIATFAGLELLCRFAGVNPVASDLNGVLLGGLLPASVAQPPAPLVRIPPAGRPPITVEEFLLVRTDFSDDQAWAELLEEVTSAEFAEEANIQPVDDPGWAGAGVDEVLAAVPDSERIAVLFLADTEAMTGEAHPLLALNPDLPEPGPDYEPVRGETRTVRVAADSAWSMFANLDIANLSWEDYLPDPDEEDDEEPFVYSERF